MRKKTHFFSYSVNKVQTKHLDGEGLRDDEVSTFLVRLVVTPEKKTTVGSTFFSSTKPPRGLFLRYVGYISVYQSENA